MVAGLGVGAELQRGRRRRAWVLEKMVEPRRDERRGVFGEDRCASGRRRHAKTDTSLVQGAKQSPKVRRVGFNLRPLAAVARKARSHRFSFPLSWWAHRIS